MSTEQAARRRDFTINAMAIDLETGDLHDPFGGMQDLRNGILRATDPELFVQDPLRALRAMQLLARKAKSVDLDTLVLIRGMVDDFDTLPPERVHEEFRKLLLKAHRPSVGLEFLADSGWISKFPELDALRGVGQSPVWHPEGDVWAHSLLAADAAAEQRSSVPEEDQETVAFAALLHDVGKPATTVLPEHVAAGLAPKERQWSAHGHDLAGMGPADRFLQRLTGPEGGKVLRKRVSRLVGEHMQPFNLVDGNAGRGAWARLHRRLQADHVDLRLLARVCQCDACATSEDWKTRSLAAGVPNWEHRTSEALFSHAEDFKKVEPVPLVMGRDLIALGMKPGRHFSVLLAACLEFQDSDASATKQDIIDHVVTKETP